MGHWGRWGLFRSHSVWEAIPSGCESIAIATGWLSELMAPQATYKPEVQPLSLMGYLDRQGVEPILPFLVILIRSKRII